MDHDGGQGVRDPGLRALAGWPLEEAAADTTQLREVFEFLITGGKERAPAATQVLLARLT